MRKVSDCASARSLTVLEQKSSVRNLQNSVTCPCGWRGKSVQSLHGHRWSAHGMFAPAQFYAGESNSCGTCLVSFSNRKLLMNHLTRGSGICLLNLLLRRPPLDLDELEAIRKKETADTISRIHKGLPAHLAVSPAFRKCGPLMPLIYTDGSVVDVSDRRHPYGPGKRKYVF